MTRCNKLIHFQILLLSFMTVLLFPIIFISTIVMCVVDKMFDRFVN